MSPFSHRCHCLFHFFHLSNLTCLPSPSLFIVHCHLDSQTDEFSFPLAIINHRVDPHSSLIDLSANKQCGCQKKKRARADTIEAEKNCQGSCSFPSESFMLVPARCASRSPREIESHSPSRSLHGVAFFEASLANRLRFSTVEVEDRWPSACFALDPLPCLLVNLNTAFIINQTRTDFAEVVQSDCFRMIQCKTAPVPDGGGKTEREENTRPDQDQEQISKSHH